MEKGTLFGSNENLLDLIAKRFKALGERSRLKLLFCLLSKEKTVTELVQDSGLSQANVSRHLQMLVNAGILSRRKDRLNVYYKICDDCIPKLCDIMCGSIKKKLRSDAKIFV